MTSTQMRGSLRLRSYSSNQSLKCQSGIPDITTYFEILLNLNGHHGNATLIHYSLSIWYLSCREIISIY